MKRKCWYVIALFLLAMLPLVGCSSGGDAVSGSNPLTVTTSGRVDVPVAKTVDAAAGAIGKVEAFNAYNTTTALGTADVLADGSFTGLSFTLPSTQAVILFKATITTPAATYYNVTPMDLTTPVTGAGLTNNIVSISISPASTAIANSVLTTLGGTLEPLAPIPAAKTFADAKAAAVSYGGSVLSYANNGIQLVGTVSGSTTPTTTTTAAAEGFRIVDKHGEAIALVEELEGGIPATVVITGASADANGLAKVTFTLKSAAGAAITGRAANAGAASFAIASLAPKGNGISYNKWVPYIWRKATVETVDTNQAYRERNTVTNLVEGPAGTYTYTFAVNLSTVTMPVGGTAVAYDRTRTHRVMVAMRAAGSGYVGGNTFDFIPAGGTVTATRDIVDDATCRKCHANTPGHYGPWNGIVKACVMCHTDGNELKNTAANGGAKNTLAASVMLHKIHAGRELPSVSGADWQYYDNQNTPVDETADNGPLYILGSVSTWNTAAFPANLANCEACHVGSVKDVGNWRTVPSRAACGSCHDNINWTTGANHSTNRAMANDDTCNVCHFDTGNSFGGSVTDAHNWTKKDIRNIPEFDITITMDKTLYVKGDKPVVTIVLKDKATGLAIDHTTIVQDPAAEGCIPKPGSEGTACTVPRDGLFTAANVYVTGPRGEKAPQLTYAARAAVRSTNAGPWDLSAGGGKINIKVDSGMPMLMYNNAKAYEGYGADELVYNGDITVTLPAAGAALNALFANPAAATAAEVAAWLNANATFKLRAIAYVDEALAGNANAGKLAIRTRGIAKLDKSDNVIETYPQRNIMVVSSVVPFSAPSATSAWATAGGADSLRKMTTANATNPKAVFSAANIKYTLDPVDDLVAGTYIIHTEFADGGRLNTGTNGEPPYTDYRTPSVGLATFQVKTATVEKPVAGSCDACHWSSGGIGFVLDNPRHNKIFDDKAVDRCGGCHDYSSGQKPDATSQLSYAGALSNRVHAVHNGSKLNYPTITVGHEETSAFGRNWNITYPMNIQNCESCHPTATTSGTWKSNPNRLACMGCHDSDAATVHMKLQTYDPTPLAPWSGDEKESCKSCH